MRIADLNLIQTHCSTPTRGSANTALHSQGDPWWWEAAAPRDIHATLPNDADVVIVGAGYTGLSAALQLLRHNLSVVIVDQARPGEGASSRNGGMLGSGHKIGYASLKKRFGHEAALRILREGLASLRYTRDLIATENIDCCFNSCGRFRGAWTPRDFSAMRSEIEWMSENIGLNASMISKTQQASEVRTRRYHGGCIYHDHASVHPGLFHAGLLERVIQAGGVLSCENQALSFETIGARKVLTTSQGDIRSRYIILATNGYRTGLSPRWRCATIPVSSYLIATEQLSAELVQSLIPNNRMIVESRKRFGYYRQSPDGQRIIFGGRAALEKIDTEKSQRILFDVMVDLFPELASVKVSHSWSGLVCMTLDSVPHIAELEDGVFVVGGYNGSGVAMAPYLGHKMAHMICDKPEGKTVFAEIPLRSVPFYNGNPWFLKPLHHYYRVLDRRQGSR